MHFDPRTQRALRAVGLDDDDLRRGADLVADALAAFFDEHETVYSDMETAHGPDGVREHGVDHLDCYTHGGDLRGYLRFDTWGVPVEDGRPLSEEKVELSLGPTVHARVRFAADPDLL